MGLIYLALCDDIERKIDGTPQFSSVRPSLGEQTMRILLTDEVRRRVICKEWWAVIISTCICGGLLTLLILYT